MILTRLKRYYLLPLAFGLLVLSIGTSSAQTWLAGLSTDFQAYDYNTSAYQQAPYGYIGCGPTTGAMILNYFQNHDGATGLMQAGGGLATAEVLHGPGNKVGPYLQTGTDGFGSPYRIRPGLEGYAADNGYKIDVTMHVSPTYTPPNPTWDAYGSYPGAWNNDGDFWKDNGSYWYIDTAAFDTFVGNKLSAGVPVFLTVDSVGGQGGGDHWIPLVGVDGDRYAYYNTWDTTMHWASIQSVWTPNDPAFSISALRTITFDGPTSQQPGGEVPEPTGWVFLGTSLLAFAGFRMRSRR